MPAVSEKQRRFMAMERSKGRSGKPTKTHMSDKQLSDFMHKGGKKKGKKGGKHHPMMGPKYRPSKVGM